jgi:hypothetical protein
MRPIALNAQVISRAFDWLQILRISRPQTRDFVQHFSHGIVSPASTDERDRSLPMSLATQKDRPDAFFPRLNRLVQDLSPILGR